MESTAINTTNNEPYAVITRFGFVVHVSERINGQWVQTWNDEFDSVEVARQVYQRDLRKWQRAASE